MRNYLTHLDRQVLDAVSIGREFAKARRPPKVSRILFCGMGGSAISGEILKVVLARSCRIPFEVNRDLRLPLWADQRTLVVFSSYSGNTEEVLLVFDQALKRKSKILVITSGGKLSKKARDLKADPISLPGGIPPRCAIGYLTFSLVQVFAKWGWFKFSPQNCREVISTLRRDRGGKPRQLARLMSERLVRFYGLTGFCEPVLLRWQAQFAENAKVLASSHLIPEMFHNEIEGYCLSKPMPQKFVAVFFRDADDPPALETKIQKAKRLAAKAGSRVLEIHSRGKSLLARLFSLIYLGDWVSYELALLRDVDPLRIPNISLIKGKRR